MDPLQKVISIVPTTKVLSLMDEFREFAFKGNFINVAIGVVIGGAFSKVVEALVKSILMPFVSLFTPVEKGYAGWTFVFNGVEIPYGVFLGEVINFLIVAAAMFFFIVKFLGWMMNVKKEDPVVVLTKQEELLIEIRDLLKAKAS